MKQYIQEASSWFLNKHLIYSQKELTAVHHVMIYMNEELYLLKQNNQSGFALIERKVTPAADIPYMLLKIFCHFSVSLEEVLEQTVQGKMPLDDLKNDLEQLYEKIAELEHNYAVSISSIKPAIHLILSYISSIIFCTSVEQLQLIQKQYLRDISPILSKYSNEAAQLQLGGLHQITQTWLNLYSINLNTTYIIIVGARGPKQELIESQFFKALYHHYNLDEKNSSSGGIIYSEMLPQQMKDLTIETLIDDFARYLHNRKIGLRMLNDIDGMNKDVLGKYAPQAIQDLINTPVSVTKKQCPLHTTTSSIHNFFKKTENSAEKTGKNNLDIGLRRRN